MSRDKRLTTRQTIRLVQDAYDRYEAIVKKVLEEEFQFTPEQMERFEEKFSELAVEECMKIEARLRRAAK